MLGATYIDEKIESSRTFTSAPHHIFLDFGTAQPEDESAYQ
jgi:hypothetical protein